MAAKRPAKLAIGKKAQQVRTCPITNKPMTAVKVFRAEAGASMMWVTIEDFNGTDEALSRMLPC